MIRLLCVTDSAAETLCAQQMLVLAARLPLEGFDVRVCVLGQEFAHRSTLEQANVPVLIERRVGFPWPAYWGLVSLVRRLRPRIVHTWGMPSSVASCLACIFDTAMVNTVFETTDSPRADSLFFQVRRLAPERLRTAADLDCVITHCQAMVDDSPAARLEVIPPGMTRDQAPKPSMLRSELGLSEADRIVGLMTDMEVADRAKDALWAMDLMKAVRDDVVLVIYGNGPGRRRLKRYAHQVRVADRVYFLERESCDAADFYSSLDMLWEPSIRRRIAPGLLEAMIRGIPVVAADTPVNNELLGDSRGTLVMAGHRAGFARQTEHLLANPDRADELADAARNYAIREFSFDAYVKRHMLLYRDLSPAAETSAV